MSLPSHKNSLYPFPKFHNHAVCFFFVLLALTQALHSRVHLHILYLPSRPQLFNEMCLLLKWDWQRDLQFAIFQHICQTTGKPEQIFLSLLKSTHQSRAVKTGGKLESVLHRSCSALAYTVFTSFYYFISQDEKDNHCQSVAM